MDGNLIASARARSCCRSSPRRMKDAMKRTRAQAMIDPGGRRPLRQGRRHRGLGRVDDQEPRPRCPAQREIELNGANQFFAYDPSMLVLSNEREAPPTPGLQGDIPLDIPANGELSGLFREDQLREASIDLDQITRGNMNPFRATLTISKNADVVRSADADDGPAGRPGAAAADADRHRVPARGVPATCCGSTSCSSPTPTWSSSTTSACATPAASWPTSCSMPRPASSSRSRRWTSPSPRRPDSWPRRRRDRRALGLR